MFSVGVLYSSKEFLEFVAAGGNIDIHFPDTISRFSVASSKAILEVSQKCEWVRLTTIGTLEITDRGKLVLDAKDPERALRIQIGHLVESYLPTWLPVLRNGRKEAQKYLPRDAKQCLREAGLFTGTDDEIVDWWDKYSKISRRAQKDTKLDVGRRGEKLTIQHERQRTNREPVWQSIESNFSGFDVLSVVQDYDATPLRIEVKTTNSTPDTAVFYVTRHEWETATASPNYIFHLWALQPKPVLTIVEVGVLSAHLPTNSGDGVWETVRVPFSAFLPST